MTPYRRSAPHHRAVRAAAAALLCALASVGLTALPGRAHATPSHPSAAPRIVSRVCTGGPGAGCGRSVVICVGPGLGWGVVTVDVGGVLVTIGVPCTPRPTTASPPPPPPPTRPPPPPSSPPPAVPTTPPTTPAHPASPSAAPPPPPASAPPTPPGRRPSTAPGRAAPAPPPTGGPPPAATTAGPEPSAPTPPAETGLPSRSAAAGSTPPLLAVPEPPRPRAADETARWLLLSLLAVMLPAALAAALPRGGRRH